MREDNEHQRFAYGFRYRGEEHVVVGVPLELEHPPSLTPAEIAVARELVKGGSNAEIARSRGTAVRTVANQVASLLTKLGLDSRSQIAMRVAALDPRLFEEA
jgi:DNA-binding NarL/FixJ family response regulator